MTKERTKKGESQAWLNAHVGHAGDECLIWPFSRKSNGYGQTTLGNRPAYAHRVMCLRAHGAPPTPRHEASHSCGNGAKGCVNPRHLRWATKFENLAERIMPFGEDASTARLTNGDAIAIVALQGRLPQKRIAELFGVTVACVSSIQSGTSWSKALSQLG